MNGTTTDQQLLQILTAAPPTTIDEVISRMESLDAALLSNHGLKWFNLLYLLVTKEVKAHPSANGWNNEQWVTRLDVVFANFYFTAVANFLNHQAVPPKSWQVLFNAKHQAGIDRIQFALAGMNAHINHDLALALLQTNAELGLNPGLLSLEHADYERVNKLLEAVLPKALEFLAVGLLGEIAQSTGKIGRLLAIWNVRAARDLAWDFSAHLHILPGLARNAALRVQDQVTGALGQSLLLPL
jgi:hypothetical protein